MGLDVNALIKILNDQKNLIAELSELASGQLQALKKNDLDEIKKITSQQEYIGRQLAVLEQKRGLFMEECSQKLGVEIKHFNELQLYTSSDDFAEVQMIRDEIINTSQKLKRENELNSLLLKQGLKYTETMLRVLTPTSSSVYGKSGDVHRAGSQGIIDTNI